MSCKVCQQTISMVCLDSRGRGALKYQHVYINESKLVFYLVWWSAMK